MADGSGNGGKGRQGDPGNASSRAPLDVRMHDRILEAGVMCGARVKAPTVDRVIDALKADKAMREAVDRRMSRRSGLPRSAVPEVPSSSTDPATLAVLDRLDGLREAVVDVQLRTQRVEASFDRSRDLGDDIRAASQEARQLNEGIVDRICQTEGRVTSLLGNVATKAEVGQLERSIGDSESNGERVTGELKTVFEGRIRGLEIAVASASKRSLLIALGILAPSVLVAVGLLLYVVLGGG